MIKTIHFSGFQAIVNNEGISEHRKKIPQGTHQLKQQKSISIIQTDMIDNRFLKILFSNGSPIPRRDNVINTDTLKEEKNPRQPNQYEPNDYFALIDYSTNLLWLNGSEKKGIIEKFLKEYGLMDVIFKDVFSEEEFLNRLTKIDKIKLSVIPNLFSHSEELTKELSTDIYGYGACEATITFKFKKNGENINEKVKKLIKKSIGNRNSYRSLTIAGRNEKNLGMLFNREIFSRKIDVDVDFDENHNIIDKEKVILDLIKRIENEDKKN